MKVRDAKDNRIVIIDFFHDELIILEDLPTQDYIDENFDGDWEEWLYQIEDERNDIPNMNHCQVHWIHTTKLEIKTIKL